MFNLELDENAALQLGRVLIDVCEKDETQEVVDLYHQLIAAMRKATSV
jgi:hypothetical protein